MTLEQKQFIIKILGQISVKVTDPKSLETVTMVQEIIKELSQ